MAPADALPSALRKTEKRRASNEHDVRRLEPIEYRVVTLVGQRVFGIALGYEDLTDHDELHNDPMLAALSGKLAARREDCAPVAGKSTFNRLELSRLRQAKAHAGRNSSNRRLLWWGDLSRDGDGRKSN